MFGKLSNPGSVDALSMLMRFAGQRQKIIMHNIANINTPGFIAYDVSVQQFQQTLGDAIDKRRANGNVGDLKVDSTSEVAFGSDGSMQLFGRTPINGPLMHDRNNRDVERLAQASVENATVYRVAADLLRSRYAMMNAAISERA